MASLRYGRQLGLDLGIRNPPGQPGRRCGEHLQRNQHCRGWRAGQCRHADPAGVLGRFRSALRALPPPGYANAMPPAASSAAKPPELSGWPRPGWGREATTHWRFAGEFAERFPGCSSAPTSTTDSDNLYCAGGTTSACDLYMYLIERFCGAHVAQGMARDVLFELQRSYSPDWASAGRSCIWIPASCRSRNGGPTRREIPLRGSPASTA